MSDVSQNQNQGIASNSAPSTPVSSSPSSTNVPASPPLKYTDEDVNNIVRDKRAKFLEQGRQEALAEFQKNQANASNQQPTQAPQLTAEQEKALLDKATAHLQQQMQVNQLVHQFASKMSEGAKAYPDFDQVVGGMKLENIPGIVQLANNFENTKDIMYDLGKNPSKIANLTVLSQINPALAQQEMQRLSDTIKKNQEAVANQPKINEPLSHIQPSTAGTDNGSMSVNDWRSQPWLRG